jgi:pentatricopeptide repeat protein
LGDAGEAREVLDTMLARGMKLTERTLNVLVRGFVQSDSLTAALEVFNSFVSAGGPPSTRTYNILIDGFARCEPAQLCNAESLASQLFAQGLAPDVYTFNALIRAAVSAGRPQRARAYHRRMRAYGVDVDACSLTLLASAHCALGRPLDAIEGARAAIEARSPMLDTARSPMLDTARSPMLDTARSPMLVLDRPLAKRLLGACSQAASDARDGARLAATARAYAHWVLDTVANASATDARALLSDARALRDLINICGHAGDFQGARRYFEQAASPRPFIVWSEMLRVCNACGNATMASELLAQQLGSKSIGEQLGFE